MKPFKKKLLIGLVSLFVLSIGVFDVGVVHADVHSTCAQQSVQNVSLSSSGFTGLSDFSLSGTTDSYNDTCDYISFTAPLVASVSADHTLFLVNSYTQAQSAFDFSFFIQDAVTGNNLANGYSSGNAASFNINTAVTGIFSPDGPLPDGAYFFSYYLNNGGSDDVYPNIPFWVVNGHFYLNLSDIPSHSFLISQVSGDDILATSDGTNISYVGQFSGSDQSAVALTYVGAPTYTISSLAPYALYIFTADSNLTSCTSYANCLQAIASDGYSYNVVQGALASSVSTSTTLVTSPDVQFIGYVVIFFLALMFAGFFMNNLKRKR